MAANLYEKWQLPLPLMEHQLWAGCSTEHVSKPAEWSSDILQWLQVPKRTGKAPLSLVRLKLPLRAFP